ncbi:MAG: hypothetical protein ACM3UU_00470 [Ignavibacteriales bacterium]
MKIENLQKGLAEELTSGTKDVAIDITEVGLDSLFNEGVAKEIPVIKSIVAVCKTGLNIKERFFTKKLIKFICEFKNESIDTIKYNEFKYKMRDPKFQDKVTERIIIILDRLEELNRTNIISKLIKGFVESKISWDEFSMFSKYVDFLTNDDIKLLNFLNTNLVNGYCINTSEHKELEGNANKLLQFNFVEMKIVHGMVFGVTPSTIIHKLTALGVKFIDCINDN